VLLKMVCGFSSCACRSCSRVKRAAHDRQHLRSTRRLSLRRQRDNDLHARASLRSRRDYYDFLDLVLRSELSQSEVARLTSRSRNYNQFLRCSPRSKKPKH
jgi:hypothetical protein